MGLLAALRPRIRLNRLTILICAFALALPTGTAYAWSSVTYLNVALLYYNGYGLNIGNANREFNRVWRPVNYDVSLFYNGVCCAVVDWQNNPFTDPRNATYTKAGCQNVDIYQRPYGPVTCLTTTP
jgi:hypothetical protein